jgi:RNA polymerase sigma factor (sigma-70 family)
MTPPRLPARILVGPALRAQPDRRLVALAREGHEPALEEVVRRYRPALVRYAATIVPPDRADDVVQDSIARALPTLRNGDSELHLRAWLYTIVRNAALNNIRDAGPATDRLDESFDGVEQPPQVLERREELAAVVAGVQALPDSQRDALVKREVEGRSHAEIGAAMGVSVAAARQLIHRGRVTLREGLGALIPMPVMRQLLDGLGAPAVAGTGAGGALAAKAVVGVLAVGGAIGAGVALDRHSQPAANSDPIVAQRDAVPGATAGGAAAAAEGSGGSEEGDTHGNRSHGASGRGSDGHANRGPRGSLGSSGGAAGGAGGRFGSSSGPGGPRSGAGLEDPGHGGDESGHHGGFGEHSGEFPEDGHHGGGGDSHVGGGGTGDDHGTPGDGGGSGEPTGEPEGESGGDSGHSGEQAGGEGSSGGEDSSGRDKPQPPEGDGPSRPDRN